MTFDWSQGDWLYFVAIFGASLSAAALAMAAISLPHRKRLSRSGSLFAGMTHGTAFLFDQHELIDATCTARELLSAAPPGEDIWLRLVAYLAPRFPGLEDAISQLPERGRMSFLSSGSLPLSLTAEWFSGLTRITLGTPGQGAEGLDSVSQRAMEEELNDLRGAMDEAPLLVWRQNPDGEVVWANRTYLTLAGSEEAEIPWPLPRLFSGLDLTGPHEAHSQRCSVMPEDRSQARWFDCHILPDRGDQWLIFALPADSAVQAETSLRSFIQTLTKTFAQLTVGLAIFDRTRQLVLFNPALIELTQLSPEFLSSRPRLPDLLDAMREKRTIPEPKDYKNWRAQVLALEKAAASGQYEETWSLPSGLTYRVTGRPHPDGAVAFLVEDISAEMSLTRRYRAELELSQAVIDGLQEAIAVFSPAGQMVVSNAAYADLWCTETSSAPVAMGILEASAWWQASCAPSPIWDRARDFVATMGEREGWSAEARLSDGRGLDCHFTPVAGGSTMVRFTLIGPGGALKEQDAGDVQRKRRA